MTVPDNFVRWLGPWSKGKYGWLRPYLTRSGNNGIKLGPVFLPIEEVVAQLIDEALDEMTPEYPADGPHAGQKLGPLDQFAHLATETDVPPAMVLTRLHRRIKEGH